MTLPGSSLREACNPYQSMSVGGLPPRRQGGAGLGTVEDPVATYLRISAATDKSNTAPAIVASKSPTEPQRKLEGARFRAFLHLIRYDENGGVSDDQAYHARIGGMDPMTDADMRNYVPKLETFMQRDKKTGKLVATTGTAAGAYQILATTWNEEKKKLGVVNIDKPTQDRIAEDRIARSRATEDIKAGRLESAIRKLNHRWTSLPGGRQSHQTIAQAKAKFNEFLIQELKKP